MLNKILFWVAIAVVAAAIVGGFMLSGSPQQARKTNLDDSRVSSLSQINTAINLFYDNKKVLPQLLSELQQQPVYYVSMITDPVTAVPFEYKITGATTYDLCATFDLASDQSSNLPVDPYYNGSTFWQHPAGNYCYHLEVYSANKDVTPLPVK
ncbi:MAG: hypothetical protein V1846_02155 [Candidatus Komeilibacteria bacterium]